MKTQQTHKTCFSPSITLLMNTALALLLVGCASTAPQKTTASNIVQADPKIFDDFSARLQSTQALIESTKTAAPLRAESQALLESGVELLRAVAQQKKECAEVLNIVADRVQMMTTLTHQQIEVDYHEGKALPESTDVCYEVKEFVVHPATVLVLLREKGLTKNSRSMMADELSELALHLDGVREYFRSN